MLGTLLWRTKEALAVFSGKKVALPKKTKPDFPPTDLDKPPNAKLIDKTLMEQMNSKTVEFIFSEFKEDRVNAGGADLSGQSRLDPSLSSLKNYFPNAKYTVYSDFDLNIEGVALKKIEAPVLQDKKDLPRHFYHLADYYKFKGMLESDADIAVAIDSDMVVWSDLIYSLVTLTEKFGFCVPSSSAQSMNFEVATSLDTMPISDKSRGMGITCNITPMALLKSSANGRHYFEACCRIMMEEPSRASIVMWKAAWKTGVYPYMLPREFCVVRGLEGIGNEALLHVGHQSVADYYNIRL